MLVILCPVVSGIEACVCEVSATYEVRQGGGGGVVTNGCNAHSLWDSLIISSRSLSPPAPDFITILEPSRCYPFVRFAVPNCTYFEPRGESMLNEKCLVQILRHIQSLTCFYPHYVLTNPFK